MKILNSKNAIAAGVAFLGVGCYAMPSYVMAAGYAIRDIYTKPFTVNSWALTNNFNAALYGAKATVLKNIRDGYNKKIESLLNEVSAELKNTDKDIDVDYCKFVSNMRESFKEESQVDSPFVARVAIYARQLEKYGSYRGLSEQKRDELCNKNPEHTLYTALKTDGGDMGLKGSDLYAAQLKCAALRSCGQDKCTTYTHSPFDITISDIGDCISGDVIKGTYVQDTVSA